MYGYQDENDLIDDLSLAIDFGAKHISTYQLTLEPGTPFYAKFMREHLNFDSVDYMSCIENFLKKHDILRYEISNFSKAGFSSKHNLTYWNYDDYFGCGPSVHGRLTIGMKKYAIVKYSNLKLWSEHIGEFSTCKALSDEEILEEMIIVGLRKISGVKFGELYQQVPEEIVKKVITNDKIDFLKKHDLLVSKNDAIQLTTDGLLKLNSVISYLLEY